VVIGILPTLGREKAAIGRLLLRMALSERSKASKAVLLSVVALASRHRGHDAVHAARAKNAATDALISAASSEMDHDASIEHIATGLTLCLVEVSTHPERTRTRLKHYCHNRRQISTAIGSAISAVRETSYPPSNRKRTTLGATQRSC